MGRGDVCIGEVAVHVVGRGQVGEAVPGPGPNPVRAEVLGREQHGVVKRWQPGSGAEAFDEPGSEDTVVDHVVPAGAENSGSSGRGPDDGVVLLVGGRGPRLEVALVDEGEEVVARHQGAGGKPAGQQGATVDLPDPGGPVRISPRRG